MGFRRSWLLAPLVVAAVMGTPLGACSSPAPLAAAGQECFQATDCMEGLICLPPSCNGGTSICSADATCVQSVEDAGADAAPNADAATATDAPMDGSAPMGGGDTGGVGPKDTGAHDTGAAKDTAPLPDTNPAVTEAGEAGE